MISDKATQEINFTYEQPKSPFHHLQNCCANTIKHNYAERNLQLP